MRRRIPLVIVALLAGAAGCRRPAPSPSPPPPATAPAAAPAPNLYDLEVPLVTQAGSPATLDLHRFSSAFSIFFTSAMSMGHALGHDA